MWHVTHLPSPTPISSSRTCLAQFSLVALCNDVTLQWIPAFHFEEVHCNTKAPAVTETDNHDVDKGLI